jgi:DNA-binding MarR family transcriptional regulator
VRRVADPNDRRSVRATLTRAGQRRHDHAIALLRVREAEIVGALDLEECAEIQRLLARLATAR